MEPEQAAITLFIRLVFPTIHFNACIFKPIIYYSILKDPIITAFYYRP